MVELRPGKVAIERQPIRKDRGPSKQESKTIINLERRRRGRENF